MEIIKQGKIPDNTITSTCRNCKTEFRFNPNECKSSIWDQREGGTIYWIDCPICKKEVIGYGD